MEKNLSTRDELEITNVNNGYIKESHVHFGIL